MALLYNLQNLRARASWGRVLGVAALLLAFAVPASAQSGKIQGRVTDAVSGEELIGVNVLIEGTTQGAQTDINGSYVIIGVRPGTYTLVASYLGYETTRVENVRVQIDLTTTINFQLREDVAQLGEVVVTAEAPLVQKDITATTAIVSGEEIRALPVENFGDVIALQAGVVNGHFRGGRLGEVGYWVDGVPVTDVFNGSLGVSVENNMVEEVQVVTGAFNAEYGNAMSGIVNVVTRDGGNQFTGGLTSFAGDYLSTRDHLFLDVGSVNPAAVRNLEGDLSGPILRNRLWFFASGRYFANDGWHAGRRIFDLGDVGFAPTGSVALLDSLGSGDSSLVAMNPYQKISGQAKLTWQVMPGIRVSVNNILSEEDFRGYNHGLRFLPQAQRDEKSWARTTFFKITHTLSNRSFYEIGLSNNYSAYRSWLFEDPLDERYRDNDFFTSAPVYASNFVVGGTDNGRFERSTNTYLAKLDFTSQVDDVNLVKAGVEFRQHELDFYDAYTDVEEDINTQTVTRNVITNGEYNYKPFEFSAYVQDKLEIGSLIINAGVRFDYFDANGKVFIDPTDRNIVIESNRNRLIAEQGEGAVFKDSEPAYSISPRLGVSFPITVNGTVHFAFGQFFQIPNFELLYRNPLFKLGGTGFIGLVGNANLKPEKTIQGEIGLKQGVGDGAAIELTAYFRDIRDLAGTPINPIQIVGTGERYGMIINNDFGFVRGIVFRYDQRFGQNLTFNADYTFQIAKANASDPAQAYNAAAAKSQLETQIIATDWDQRHTVNISMSYRSPQNWGFGLIGNVGTGLPYTPSLTTAQSGAIIPTTIPLNSETRPMTYNINLNAYKDFTFGENTLQVFAKVDNLFDTANEFGIFGDTGRATYSLQKNVDATSFQGPAFFLDEWYTRPDFYSQPRRVALGVSYRF